MSSTLELIAAADLLIATSWETSPEDFDARLAAFVAESADTLAALRVICKAYESKADACKSEAKVYAGAAKSATNRAERVESLAAMLVKKAAETGEILPGAKMVSNGGGVPLLYSATFVAAELPFAYQAVVVVPDSAAIRAALEQGESVPGVALGTRGEHLKWTEEPTAKANK